MMKADKETTFMRPSTFGGRAAIALLAVSCLLAGATRAAARQSAPSAPDAADPPAASAPQPDAAEPTAPQKQTVVVNVTSEPKPSMTIYGFAMLDIGHDFKQINPNWSDTMRVTKLPSFENQFGEDNNTFAGVRQSRLGVKASTPTSLGELKTTFEFELFGTGVDEGQTTFRLRHAYGELGHFGAGQTWSPFMDPDVFPNSLEYWGPTGMVFFRNVQVRWMPIQGDRPPDARARAAGRQRRRRRLRRPHRAAEHQGPLPGARLSAVNTPTARSGATSGWPACCARSSGTTCSTTSSI